LPLALAWWRILVLVKSAVLLALLTVLISNLLLPSNSGLSKCALRDLTVIRGKRSLKRVMHNRYAVPSRDQVVETRREI